MSFLGHSVELEHTCVSLYFYRCIMHVSVRFTQIRGDILQFYSKLSTSVKIN